tara:strand:- start:485 stop:1894 length:1410 start_codon:yes stop_codon:yes gene_type:complete
MAISYNSGVLKSSDITATTSDAGTGAGQRPDRRRLFNFGDRVAELTPEESPFFVYLSKVAKSPTDDSVFRYLENRNKVNFTDRSFKLAADVNGESAVAAGTSYSFVADTSGGAAVEYLLKGMVFAVNSLDSAAGFAQVLVRVESAVAHGSVSSSFTGKVIDISANIGTGFNVLSDNDDAQIIGTSFEEGSGSPDVFSSELEDGFGYTQIFKTAAEMTNTAYATKYRGYSDEWSRIWADKLREHKIDIERAMLFGQKARSGGIQYTEGLVGHILKNVSPQVTDTTDFAYSSGSAYYRSVEQSGLTYDRLLSDLEVIFDPARGGSSDKLVLCSNPVITFFNKLGSDAFLNQSLRSGSTADVNTGNSLGRYDMSSRDGAFGHTIMVIDTIHGRLNLVKEPLFRGISSGFMLMADMSQIAYRPLIGNGINRDTQVMTNVQSADEDLRKDMILTEAGLEVTLSESHALYNVEGL